MKLIKWPKEQKTFFLTALVSFLLGGVVALIGMQYFSKKVSFSGADAAMLQADEALSHGDLNSAIGFSYGAIYKNPDSYLPYALLGDIFAKRGEKTDAIRMYKITLQNFNYPSIRKTRRL